MLVNVNIKPVKLKTVARVFAEVKPDLIDGNACYFGAFVAGKLVGIVSYVEHEHVVYLGHAFVLDNYRNKGVYNMLVEYRERHIKEKFARTYSDATQLTKLKRLAVILIGQ